MILLNDDDQDQASSKLAAVPVPTLRLPEPVAGRASPLPDYETSQLEAQHSVIFRKPSFPNRFDSRFWRATFFALAIYVFLSIVIGVPLIVTRITARKSQPIPPNLQSLFIDDSEPAAPLNAGGIMMAEPAVCDDWHDTGRLGAMFTATTHHTLTPSGLFSIRSNATHDVVPRSGGAHNLTVAMNDDPSATKVVLNVRLVTSTERLRDVTHMCFASTGNNRGLSVYMPQGLVPPDYLAFDIRLLFPKTARYPAVSNLVTYLPMFQQSFGYLSPDIGFQSVNIAGAGVDIVCDSIKADKIAVKTSFASLSGNFSVTQSLKLDNIRGAIYTNATVYNDPSQGLPTFLAMDTGDSDIVADVTMVAPAKSNGPSPLFLAHVKTFNGSLSLNVAHNTTTPPASLSLEVDNNQGLSTVTLDSKFQGLFELYTKLAPATMSHAHTITDPSGGSRKWHVEVDSKSLSWTRGWMGFGTRPAVWNPATDGRVVVASSLSPAMLRVVN